MKAGKIDRRVKYTTYLLRESLISLMQTTPISKISVKRLCEGADINRSTFYAHYTDPYDLLQKLEQEVVAELNEYINSHETSRHSEMATQILKQVLEYAAKNSGLFKVLLGENSDAQFQEDIMALAQQKMIADVRNAQNLDARISEYLQCFIISGALKIIEKWLLDGMVETPQQMAELISKLLFQGISFFFD
ncbi:MAG TPA: TetR/AcrR family transcriptional regulator [Firmicutes bacterium]|jgi:AcrR family transcriptional regulator|nr:TetR/AcrR family transcriptional regulator [Bacillota bacterium]